MVDIKKLSIVSDIVALKILIADLNDRLDTKIEELTQIELEIIINEKVNNENDKNL